MSKSKRWGGENLGIRGQMIKRNMLALLYMIIGINKINSLGSCQNKRIICMSIACARDTRETEDVSLCSVYLPQNVVC